jgi:2-oxoglutarate/2-oxoacid ferredoxin oxidoreductase subunit beta
MSTVQDFSGYTPTWCPGCGDWGIGMAIKKALTESNLEPSSVFLSFDIGCSGNMNDFLNGYAMHGLHGRAIPTAIGMKTANQKMTALVIGGDGGTYGEGGNHFMHACRGNHDITVVVHDNMVYGLTTGQVAPTAKNGFKSKSTPQGILEQQINPLLLALSQGATFVSQAFAGDLVGTADLIKQAIAHKGFSLVNILQPCVTFNKINTYQYFLPRVYKLDASYDKASLSGAIQKACELAEEKFPVGVYYQNERPSFHEQLTQIPSDSSLLARDAYSGSDALLKEFI